MISFFPLFLQSSLEEEDEEGALSDATLERAQIQEAPAKEIASLGVRKAGTVAFWKAAHGLPTTEVVCLDHLKDLSPSVDSSSFLDA